MARLAIGAVAGYSMMEWWGVFAAVVSAGMGALLARFAIREDAGSLPERVETPRDSAVLDPQRPSRT